MYGMRMFEAKTWGCRYRSRITGRRVDLECQGDECHGFWRWGGTGSENRDLHEKELNIGVIVGSESDGFWWLCALQPRD